MNSGCSREEIYLHIVGMTCGGCVSRVERALRGVAGVRDAAVSLLTESARVVIDDAAAVHESLTAAVRAAGYDAEVVPRREELIAADQDDPQRREQLRRHRQAMILAIGLALPILALDQFGLHLQATHAAGDFGRWLLQGCLLLLLLCGPAGAPILAGGARALWHRSGNMDLLIALGVSVAFASSVYGTFALRSDFVHYHAAAMILALVAVGRYLEARARGRTSAAVAALARRSPRTALVRRDGQYVPVPVEQIESGTVFSVPPHHAIATDGQVIEGRALVEESLMTGEPLPVTRSPGDAVLGGTLVVDGTLTVRAAKAGRDSTLSRIVRLVADAQRGRTEMQRLADRVAGVFTPLVVLTAALVFAAWLALRGTASLGSATSATVAVLVVACPCAMGLATPTVIVVASGLAALRGILVRQPAMLEALGRVDTVVWDKTGTLTYGRPAVVEVRALDSSWSSADVIRLATGAEQFASHPCAAALVLHARREGLPIPEPAEFESVPGGGVAAVVEGRRVVVGGADFVAGRADGARFAADELRRAAQAGDTLVCIAIDGRAAGLVRLRDELRPSAPDAVRRLHGYAVRSVMLTGDGEATAQAIAREAGIDEVRAAVKPDGKVEFVRSLRAQGRHVAMVGDGINDASALSAADVGVAFATGSDVATEAAGINLIGSTPRLVADAVELSRASIRIIRQNLVWAFGYNVLMIPLAAVGVLPPWLAAGAMMGSSLTVVLNALRLPRRMGWRLPSIRAAAPTVAGQGASV